MPALSDFGIVSIATALTKNFKLRKTVEIADPVLSIEGEFVQNATYGPDYTFEADGSGDLPADFALADTGPTITGLSGGISLVLAASESQAVGRHNEWRASGEHAPAAS
jgi:hypothetical protein